MIRVTAAILLMLSFSGAGAAETPLTTDLSRHTVSITSSFSGADIVLFGTREEAGDVVVVVRGPASNAVVRRKHRVLGIWINTEEVVFDGSPSYYAVAASRPLGDIAPQPVLLAEGIGIDNLHPGYLGPGDLTPARVQEFRLGWLRQQEAGGRYVATIGAVSFLGAHLFRATIAFPASLPFGTYAVETLLLRDGAVVARDSQPLHVVEAGVDAGVSDFARNEALAYGLIAVAAAALTGYLASLAFRNY
jgi:uncharacterized protein (TIGR02186 family)